uniref:Complex I intermediate-associated protein 30, mitochondrial n=1 Tax=Cacopsylla melanoneura TaxID=428564 RepID=A0A8D8TNS7_9HEMI
MFSSRAPLRLISPISQLAHHIHTSSTLSATFWESGKKFGYESFDPNKKPSMKEKFEMYKGGLHDIKKGVKMWKEEVKETWLMDPEMGIQPNQMDVVWKFEEASLENWVVTCDKDHGEGFSNANLEVSTLGHGMFSGELSTNVPQDGVLKKSGYVNLRSKRYRKSFEREACYEWPMRTHLVIRCRGDGRSYMVNLHTPGEFDLSWADTFSYILFTRGGPYWQATKIPFSKFFLSSKGRVQDKQEPIPTEKVSSIGLSLVDQNNGPFQLELDYIGIEYDPSHQEEFAYEMYLMENEVRGIVNW